MVNRFLLNLIISILKHIQRVISKLMGISDSNKIAFQATQWTKLTGQSRVFGPYPRVKTPAYGKKRWDWLAYLIMTILASLLFSMFIFKTSILHIIKIDMWWYISENNVIVHIYMLYTIQWLFYRSVFGYRYKYNLMPQNIAQYTVNAVIIWFYCI